jgi:acyl-CoA thioester hydrolase
MTDLPKLIRPEHSLASTHNERVRFGDTDAAGIVYYANFYKWFEAGRSELMRAAGVPYTSIVDQGRFMPVIQSWCRYHTPARYDDLLRVESWVHELKAATIVIAHRIEIEERLVCEGGARLACVNTAGRVCRIPDDIREVVQRATHEG